MNARAIFRSFLLTCLLPAATVHARTMPEQAPAAGRDVTILIAGDLLGPYGATMDEGDPGIAALVRLIRSADAAFANQEGNSFDKATNPAVAAAAENGGGYPIQTLAVMRGFKEMGFDLISRANNHATDWGSDGMLASDRALDAIGYTHAGTGAALADARRASVFIAPGGARVGLIATASTFPGMAPAGEPIRGGAPRAGLNPLRVTPVTGVTAAEFRTLLPIARRGGWQGRDLPGKDSRDLYVGEAHYRLVATPGLTYDVSPQDREAILAEVKAASPRLDTLIFSIHAHETASGGYEDPKPAAFLPPLFHAAIDDGADVVVRSGPHAVQGVEIYRGKPIFYGLGHFFFDLPRQLAVSAAGGATQMVSFPDTWWLGAVATVTLHDGALREVRIYPLRIEGAEGAKRGYPSLATGEAAHKVLEMMRTRSAAFGTRMRIVGDMGVITVE